MKIRALILLFPFAVYLTETVVFPAEVNKTCKKMSCVKMNKPMKCHGKKSNNQKSSGKCDTNPDCTLCPVCFTFTFHPQYEWSAKSFPFEKNYRQVSAGYISAYLPPVWKPPNSYFLYS
jgi:hypothetical protein